jgi:hypothetical protein
MKLKLHLSLSQTGHTDAYHSTSFAQTAGHKHPSNVSQNSFQGQKLQRPLP